MIANRKVVNCIAAVVAALVLLAGALLLVGLGISVDPPEKTTTVVETGSGTGPGKNTKTIEVTTGPNKDGNAGRGPGKGRNSGAKNRAKAEAKKTTTVEKATGTPAKKETTTIELGARSFFERVGGKTGQIMLEIGVIILAAFFAGAFIQRILLGDFSIKLGNMIELGAAQEAASGNIEALAASLAKVEKEAKDRIDAVVQNFQGTTIDVVKVGVAVAALRDKVKDLEEKIGDKS